MTVEDGQHQNDAAAKCAGRCAMEQILGTAAIGRRPPSASYFQKCGATPSAWQSLPGQSSTIFRMGLAVKALDIAPLAAKFKISQLAVGRAGLQYVQAAVRFPPGREFALLPTWSVAAS
jgi:hypothetical protein